ncbi:dephospho-CoA kinase-like [Bidens hawaiensis]|uniref:dephospho-CoA kinase-like n=1 Tax=Bidens hawaiensis TaxID=980011 RepID=UPI0040493A60
MRIIGLTGGVAAGKSTVSNLFKASGLPVVDADAIARIVVKKGSGGLKKVVAAFGEDIFLENGEIDRLKLGGIVFGDPSKLEPLSRLLAPYISRRLFWEVLKLWVKGYKIIVLDIPLLFETKRDRWTSPTIVVWIDTETQLKRLMARDGSSAQDAQNRINAQMPMDVKRSKADIVIDNNGSVDDLNENFKKILDQVTKPLTWKEFWLSRQGVTLACASILTGVLGCKKLIEYV